MKAKKLDVDIGDEDDFFDSFDPAPKTQATGLIKTETDANPFATAVVDAPKTTTLADAGGSTNNDAFVQQRLKELAGKKAISSEDFEQREDESREQFSKFQGASAISSDAFFGNGPEEEQSDESGRDSLGAVIADKAVVVADGVVAGAKVMKDKLGGFLSQIRDR